MAFIAVFCIAIQYCSASSLFDVMPVIIDEKARARDIIKESVIITNNSARRLNVYAFVNDILAGENGGKQDFQDPSVADKSASLANWIEIARGVIDLAPGEKKTVNFSVNVNLDAKPGAYHTSIVFAEGSTRAEAEKKISNSPSVMVNVEVNEEVNEFLQLKKFIPDKTFFSGLPASFTYEIENIGNRELTPQGEIVIYNKKGEEVASINVNERNVAIPVGASAEFKSLWKEGSGFGKYKALLNIEYGNSKRGVLNDTVFFFVVPWVKILVVFLVMAAIISFFVHYLHGRGEKRHAKKSPRRHNANNEKTHIIDLRNHKS